MKKLKYSVNIEMEIEVSDNPLSQPYTYLSQELRDGKVVLSIATQNIYTGETNMLPIIDFKCKDYKNITNKEFE